MPFEDFTSKRVRLMKAVPPVTIARCGSAQNVSIRRELAERIGLLDGPGAKLKKGIGADLGSFAVVPGDRLRIQDKGPHRVMVAITSIMKHMGMASDYKSKPRFVERRRMLVVWPGETAVIEGDPEPEQEPEQDEAPAEETPDEAPGEGGDDE